MSYERLRGRLEHADRGLDRRSGDDVARHHRQLVEQRLLLGGVGRSPTDGGKSFSPVFLSRSSLAGNPGMKIGWFGHWTTPHRGFDGLLPTFPVLDLHHRLDPAADVEVAFDVEIARIERGDEVVGDAVRDRFVERAFIAVRPEIELERLQLDALLHRACSGCGSWRSRAAPVIGQRQVNSGASKAIS